MIQEEDIVLEHSDMTRYRVPNPLSDDRYRVNAAARAMQLLELLAGKGSPMRLKDLTAELGWNKTTVYRLVRTLQEVGAVREQPPHGFLLGPMMIRIGQAAINSLELVSIARPHLEQLHEVTGETVNLAILERDRIQIVDRVEGAEILGLRLRPGSTLPAYCTSVGLVLLAWQPAKQVQTLLRNTRFEQRGPNTIRSVTALLKRLEQVRAEGYAINDEELAAGHRAAAAPVRDYTGEVVAAVNVSVPAARRTRGELIRLLIPPLRTAADRISREAGWMSVTEGRRAVRSAGRAASIGRSP